MKGHSYNPNGCETCGKIHVNPFKGKIHSKEFNDRIGKVLSKANKGKPKSKDHKEKIRQGNLGKKRSIEVRKNMSEGQKNSTYIHPVNCKCSFCSNTGKDNQFYGKMHSKTTIERLSKLQSERLMNGFGKITGKFYSEKIQKEIKFRSNWEFEYMQMLEKDDDVIMYDYEPMRINFIHAGVRRYLVPDILVKYKNGKRSLVEIRPEWRLKDKLTKLKMKEMYKYCSENDLTFEWIYSYSEKKQFRIKKEV